MIELTQSSLDPGNCWQTAIACLLELNPEKLPDQLKYDNDNFSYRNIMNAYLVRHHGLIEIHPNLPPELQNMLRIAEPGWHLISGYTVRSSTNGDRMHVVVGRYGEVVWDPHPSRAGLLSEEDPYVESRPNFGRTWEFLAPLPKGWRGTWEKKPCGCPACNEDVSNC